MTRHDLYSHLSHVMIQNYSKVQGVKDSIVYAKRKKKILKKEKKSTFKALFKLIRTRANEGILTSQSHPANCIFLHKMGELSPHSTRIAFALAAQRE